MKISAIVRDKESMILTSGSKDGDTYTIYIENSGHDDDKLKKWGRQKVEVVDAIKEFYLEKLSRDVQHWHHCALTLSNDFKESEKLRTNTEHQLTEVESELETYKKLMTSIAIVRFGKNISIEKLNSIKWPKYVVESWMSGVRILFYSDEIYDIQKKEILELIKDL
jgi:hypothetical protein